MKDPIDNLAEVFFITLRVVMAICLVALLSNYVHGLARLNQQPDTVESR